MGAGGGRTATNRGARSVSKRSREKALLDNLEDTGQHLDPLLRLRKDEEDDPPEYLNDPYWSPTPYSAFKLLVSARFAAGLWTTISDCDETFNYWEPAHYLLYGKGFQTWEYSPEFALRSYTYILFHAVPAKLYSALLRPTPLLSFFFLRCFLAFVCASGETLLYRGVRTRWGGNVARVTLVTSLFSTGMFISSTAFLPSAFSMMMTAFAFGAWLHSLHELAIFSTALSALLSWPFAAATGVMLAADILLVRKKVWLFIKWSVISLVVVLGPVVALDSNMYGKLVVAPLNIVRYNLLSEKGPDLYGTEPWSFYFLNGTLNFNLTFALALLAPFFILGNLKREHSISAMWRKLAIPLTIYTWLLIFVPQPHKEERFLFPIYTLIPVAGALGIDALQKLTDLFCSKLFLRWAQGVNDFTKVKWVWDYRRVVSGIGVAALLTSSLLSSSRIVALYYGYRAPFDVYFALNRDAATQRLVASGRNVTVCYGKEWYRFPSSFFLPSLDWDVRWVECEFRGLLPAKYPPFDPEGTKRVPSHFNDWNREEPSLYAPLSSCDFLVDLIDLDSVTERQPNYAENTQDWKIVAEQYFLNAKKSDRFFRAFYVPFLSASATHYDRYVILRRIRKKERERLKNKKRGKEFDEDDI